MSKEELERIYQQLDAARERLETNQRGNCQCSPKPEGDQG